MVRSRHAPVLATVALLVPFWAAIWPFAIDDAWIFVRYARRLAGGAGYGFNDGPPSDGLTGPLWVVPLALASRLGWDELAVAKGLGAVCAALALALVVRHARIGALGRARAFWVGAFGATSLPFVVWAVAGLESGAAALALCAGALASIARPRPRPYLAGASFASLAWLRPELLACALALCTWLALRDRKAGIRALALTLLGIAGVLAFRLALFGHALPLSASAKPPSLANGAAYLGRAALSPRALAIAATLVLLLRIRERRTRALGVALGVHALAVVLAGGDWMPGRRLFAPLVPLLALALGSALARAALRARVASASLAALLLIANVHELLPELTRVRNAGLLQRARLPRLAELVCRSDGPIAMVDVGALGVACPRASFLDLGGLVDAEIAQARGGHLDKRISQELLVRRAPSCIVLHSRERPRIDELGRVRWFAGYPIERRVLAFPYVQNAYAAEQIFEYAEDYFYVLLSRRP